MAYDIGSLVRVSVLFYQDTAGYHARSADGLGTVPLPSGGTATDPSVVNLKFENPHASTTGATTATNPAVVKDSTGNYHYDIDTTSLSGRWQYRWYSTGTGQAAVDGYFDVDASPLS